jgi:hemerythrin-like domain-containing protein
MQAIQLLKQEHGKAKSAFQGIESAPASQRAALWAKLRPELELHEKMEETCLYTPVAREVQGDRALTEWESTHHHEVQEAERLIKEIDHLDPSDSKWLTSVKQLHSVLEQHIRKEEGEIWPRIERTWSARRLEEAGSQMEAMKHDQAAAAR